MTPRPDAGTGPRGFRVAVLTCQDFAWETVAALTAIPELTVVGVVRAPLPRPGLTNKLKRTWRRDGAVGIAAAVWRMATRAGGAATGARPAPVPVPGVPQHEVASLNAEACRALLRSLDLDLAVLDGTNILKPETFDIPRLGSINLHCGRLPAYRGAPPAFWELMAGEREVGVTVHQVSAELDAGAIYAEGSAPLDPAPAGDPVAYADRVWREVLRPLGLQLICRTALALARGEAEPRPQPHASTPANRIPSRRELQRLRAVVAARRRAAGATR
ncbi:MAG TPA: formyltransferase family protein [Gemmatimonadaceae bacterium]|nr:formyltransferase family protein [Gemmatimonadaceae bacterium]HPV76540.1 formyltransferase family protein [Gemmatimonadaceae bacterium]